MKNEDKISNV